MNGLLRAGLLPVALALVACGGADGGADASVFADATSIPDARVEVDAGAPADAGAQPDAATPDAGTMDAGQPAATWAEVRAIFVASCSPCHDPNNTRRRSVVRDYAAIVDVMRGSFVTVTSGDSSSSLLYRKVAGTQRAYCTEQGEAANRCGDVMPPTPRARLSAADVEAIRSWIDDGAPEN